MKFSSSNNIRPVILIPFTLILLLVIVLFIGTGYVREQQAHGQALQNTLKHFKNEFRAQLDNDAEMMHVAIAALFEHQGIFSAFQARDRQALYDLARPIFEHFKKEHSITHFYFVTPERKTLLRVHQFDRHGDTINRLTMVQAEKTRESAFGLELGNFGTFTHRIVVPWRVDGQLIGYVELGEEIDHIINDIAKRFDVQLLTTIKKGLLQSTVPDLTG